MTNEPLDESGDHPPGVEYRVSCTANDGTTVTLLDGQAVIVTYVFKNEKDAAYFVVGQSYVVLASPAGE